MILKKIVSFLIALLFIVTPTTPAFEVQSIQAVESGSYYERVKEAINVASESIFIVMPRIEFDSENKHSKVTQLLKALVRAKRRGVFVFVLLNLESSHATQTQAGNYSNVDAFFFLMDNGVDVHFDNLEESLGPRFVVVDRKKVLLGSSAWDYPSLENGVQVDLELESETYGKYLIDFITSIDIHDNPLSLDYYDQLYLPVDLAFHPNGTHLFTVNEDEEGLALYIYLLQQHAKNPDWGSAIVNIEEATKFMNAGRGKVKKMGSIKLLHILKRLKEKYVLIDYKGIDDDSGLLKVSFYSPRGVGKIKLPHREGIRISNVFFEAGWFWNLSLRAKYVYFYLLALESDSGYGTWFNVTFKDNKNNLDGLSQGEVVAAIRELREKNLITVTYLSEQATQDPNYFDFDCLIQTPYFDSWLDKKIRELPSQYPTLYVTQAVNIAKGFLSQKNLQVIEKIIALFEKYPSWYVLETYRLKIEPLPFESPFKSFEFFVELLKEREIKALEEHDEQRENNGTN